MSTTQVVADHIESSFGVDKRGKRHGVPSKEKDVSKLVEAYKESEVHAHKPGRPYHTGDEKKKVVKDYVQQGAHKMLNGVFFKHWHQKRAFPRSTDENFDEWLEHDSEDEMEPQQIRQVDVPPSTSLVESGLSAIVLDE